ncbi:MAG: hypothetical protein WCE75_08825 [Terracidiphilus sp.]
MSYLKELLARLRAGRLWIAAQFVGAGLLLLLGVAWTRLPEKHLWQVLLSLVIPLVFVGGFLVLAAGTARRLVDRPGPRRTRFWWGALTLFIWLALGWLAWTILDWADDHIYLWAAYLNSKAAAGWRARLFTFNHLVSWFGYLEWVLRWVVVPGKLLPYAAASALWGWRLPQGRVLRLLFNWRWWAAWLPLALLAVALPAYLFAGDPHGAVSSQVWRVGLKLGYTYLAGVASLVLLLGWLGVLLARQPEPAADALDQDLFRRLGASRRWVWAQLAWAALAAVVKVALPRLGGGVPEDHGAIVAFFLLAIALQLMTVRSLLADARRPARLVWGACALMAWILVGFSIPLALSLWYHPFWSWVLGLIVGPAVLIPFGSASSVWAFRLPWRRLLRVLIDWLWWLGVVWAAVVGLALPALIVTATGVGEPQAPFWSELAKQCLFYGMGVGAWVLVLGWFAVRFARKQPPAAEAPVATYPAPPTSLSAKTDASPSDGA